MPKEKNFYFLSNQYFQDFPDKGLMINHEIINGKNHNRPYFYMLKDKENPEIMWMIPISSKTKKYKAIYDKALAKYKRCDTISIGKILGKEHAFLVQNICPVTQKYIANQYYRDGKAVTIMPKLERELFYKANRILDISKKGIKVTFTDIKTIKQELIKQLELEEEQEQEKEQELEKKQQEESQSLKEKDDKQQKQEQAQQKEAQSIEQNANNQEQVPVADKKEQQPKQEAAKAISQEKPKPIRRGGRVVPMQFPPSTRQPFAPIKRKTVKKVEPQPNQPTAEKAQETKQPKPKVKRKIVLAPKQDKGNDRYRGR